MSVVAAPLPREASAVLPLPGLGLAVLDPPFHRRARAVARLFAALPPAVREALLYNDTRLCMPAQKALQRLLGGRRPLTVRFTAGRLAGRTFACLYSEKYFLMGAHYEAGLQRRLAALVRRGDVVYAVGAHAGDWAMLLADAAAPDGRVFAFEPSPFAFARLLRNLRANGTAVTPVNAGASDTAGEGFLAERGSESRVVDVAVANGRASRIRLVRLDDFVGRDGRPAPTFLKIDVEGHAGRCLGGADAVLAERRTRLLVEVHDPAEVAAVHERLERHGYAVAPLARTSRFPRHVTAEPRR
jgi:FkbM family methyltransferase